MSRKTTAPATPAAASRDLTLASSRISSAGTRAVAGTPWAPRFRELLGEQSLHAATLLLIGADEEGDDLLAAEGSRLRFGSRPRRLQGRGRGRRCGDRDHAHERDPADGF